MKQQDEHKLLDHAPFNDIPETEQRYMEHWDLFEKYKNEKETHIRFFNKNGIQRNIYDYVKDSVDRMNEFRLRPEWKEDWQNNVFDPITRDKLIAILSMLASSRMKPEVVVKDLSIFTTSNTKQRASVYRDLLESSNRHNNDDDQLIWEMFTAMSEGTVFGYEGWARDTKEIEYVKDYNPDTGEKETETIKVNDWDDVFGEIVPIEEIFPETIWVSARDFQRKVKRCFRAREMTFAQFRDSFGGFKKAKEVKTLSNYTDSVFDWGIPNTVNQENVFVLEFYDSKKGKMGIWANGVELYFGCLPFNHGRLPFWVSIFEPIHHQFLFGKSLPDKLMGMQDTNNALFNSILDQLYLALNSPIFIDGDIDIDENYLEPGRIVTGTPGSTAQRMALGQVDQTSFQVLGMIKRSMEESSVSAQAQGVATGGRKTKFEVQQLQESALNLASLFLQLMERAMRQKYFLRLYNVLQYNSMPSTIKSGKKQFKFITVDNTTLSNGQKGKRMMQIVGSKNEIPSKEELTSIAEREIGARFDPEDSKIEPIVITAEYLKNKEIELEIDIIPNSSVKDSEVTKSNKDIAFFQMTAGNPMFDQKEIAKGFARAFNKPEEIVVEQAPQQQMDGEQKGLQGGAGGTQGMPALDIDNDIL